MAYELRISDWSSDVCSSDLQARHPGQHAGLVLDEDRQEVVVGVGDHCTKSSPRAGSVMMASLLSPAGTIGNTFSEESVRKSMTTGRSSISLAFWIADSTSSGESTRIPTQPMASAQSL